MQTLKNKRYIFQLCTNSVLWLYGVSLFCGLNNYNGPFQTTHISNVVKILCIVCWSLFVGSNLQGGNMGKGGKRFCYENYNLQSEYAQPVGKIMTRKNIGPVTNLPWTWQQKRFVMSSLRNERLRSTGVSSSKDTSSC